MRFAGCQVRKRASLVGGELRFAKNVVSYREDMTERSVFVRELGRVFMIFHGNTLISVCSPQGAESDLRFGGIVAYGSSAIWLRQRAGKTSAAKEN